MTSVLVVCGLNREAAIAAGAGVLTVAGGGSRAGLEAALGSIDSGGIQAVISFGLAGALDPWLKVGDVVLPDIVLAEDGLRCAASPRLLEDWRQPLADLRGFTGRLSSAHPGESRGPASRLSPGLGLRRDERGGGIKLPGTVLLGVDAPVLTADGKRRLREATGAVALDMESHVAAAWAAAHGLPFGALRVISDEADHTLPPVAGSAMRPDGSVDVMGVLTGLTRDPGQIPALIRTARDAARAFRALRRVRGLLGPRLGLHL